MGVAARKRRLDRLARSLFPEINRPARLAEKAAGAVKEITGLPFVSVALKGASGLAMRGTAGARHDQIGRVQIGAGQGIGGRATALGRVVTVRDYVNDPGISRHFVDIVTNEGLGGMTAVPVFADSAPVGVLYGGIREVGEIGDVVRRDLEAVAHALSPLLAMTAEVELNALARVAEERHRIAAELHDNVGQLLFSISTTAGLLRVSDPHTADLACEIEGQAKLAGSYLREALSTLLVSSPAHSLLVQVRIALHEFSNRTGVGAELIVQGDPIAPSGKVELYLLRVLREALHNVEKHAAAGLVVVTVRHADDGLDLIVQDDGAGLPSSFDLWRTQREGSRFGLGSLARMSALLGGSLEVDSGEDGGTVLRVAVPTTTSP